MDRVLLFIKCRNTVAIDRYDIYDKDAERIREMVKIDVRVVSTV